MASIAFFDQIQNDLLKLRIICVQRREIILEFGDDRDFVRSCWINLSTCRATSSILVVVFRSIGVSADKARILEIIVPAR